jgi:hypothetical protein
MIDRKRSNNGARGHARGHARGDARGVVVRTVRFVAVLRPAGEC